MLVGWSLVLVGVVLLALSLNGLAKKRIRVFYGVVWEGRRAIGISLAGTLLGVALILFGALVVPWLFDIQSLVRQAILQRCFV